MVFYNSPLKVVLCSEIILSQIIRHYDKNINSEGRKEGRKEMFYLTMHSTNFNLRLYGVRHMAKDHSDNERGNPLPPHGLLFPISIKGSFICIIHKQDNTYHCLCYTSRGALAGTRNSSMGLEKHRMQQL